jgi:23S rRNA (cytidine1920-2'-O)/16S rRNA (cytidine1409-2'-O)-methyltransferase
MPGSHSVGERKTGERAVKARPLRLDEVLVERGEAPDLARAAAMIMARLVRVGDRYITKPGHRVGPDVQLTVVGRSHEFVSRGGVKLNRALDAFELGVAGLTVLDAGASTGGFTDCLLRRGAALVYAVDVGFGQLRGKLASDPRVLSLERTNVSDLRVGDLQQPIDLCVADLSYLSVLVSLPILAALFERPVKILHLIKPLFEGVALEDSRDPQRLRDCLLQIQTLAEGVPLHLVGFAPSPIRGSQGTIEFFGLFSGQPLARRGLNPDQAVAEATRTEGLDPDTKRR